MYILYLDESGNPDDAADRHFVLGGAAVFERTTFFLTRELDNLQDLYFPGSPPVEFHASWMRAGQGYWRRVEKQIRESLLQEMGRVISRSNDPGVVLFGVAIEKSDEVYGHEAVRRAVVEICERFDIFLMKRHQDVDDKQRGLLVFADSRFKKMSKVWVDTIRREGTDWRMMRNLSDSPYFASPQDNRLLQVADFVAHAVYQYYEKDNAALIEPFLHRFNRDSGGVLHGLVHVTRNLRDCPCPSCKRKREYGGGS